MSCAAHCTPDVPLFEDEPIAAAVAFLASRDAAWITGTALCVDGGLTAVDTGFHMALRGARG